jgi:hypothetical protein
MRIFNVVVYDFWHSLQSGTNEKERALDEYLDLCEADEGVKKVMDSEQLYRPDLKQIYADLQAGGLGLWVASGLVVSMLCNKQLTSSCQPSLSFSKH